MNKKKNWLFDTRCRLRLSQTEMASRLKVSAPTLSRLESGDGDDSITADQLAEVAGMIGCTTDELIKFRDDERKAKKLWESGYLNQKTQVAAMAYAMKLRSKADKTDDEKLKELADKLGITVEELLKLLPGDMQEGEKKVKPAPTNAKATKATVATKQPAGPSTWPEALKACGGDYVKARNLYPALCLNYRIGK